ncbi:hypothetical protein M0P48_05745 [Candidatus Gracilibacteria bacterium]|nr:hypothetical protein [Candidatus Gracilibacteria bacterium]
MRKNLVKNSYEQLKDLTRGKGGISKTTVQSFIKKLKIKAEDKKALLDLTPEKYVGLATKLVDDYELKSHEGCSPLGCSGCSGCGGLLNLRWHNRSNYLFYYCVCLFSCFWSLCPGSGD